MKTISRISLFHNHTLEYNTRCWIIKLLGTLCHFWRNCHIYQRICSTGICWVSEEELMSCWKNCISIFEIFLNFITDRIQDVSTHMLLYKSNGCWPGTAPSTYFSALFTLIFLRQDFLVFFGDTSGNLLWLYELVSRVTYDWGQVVTWWHHFW